MKVLTLFSCALLGATAAAALTPPPTKTAPVVFNRDIRPILSDNCFACHGPDKNKRQAGLRLDLPNPAVVPGDILASKLVQEVRSGAMPPASFHKTLTAAQKQLLMRWIGEGAAYQKHWSFEPPVKAAIPAGKNPVDFLVQKRLAEIGLKPSPTADRRTLIRRLSFDLLGLPPTPAEVAAFEKDTAPDAYAKLVERLLANPHYGERMAQGWLDVVRYADTIGYHSDTPRNVWPYRDYVINAFNTNKPFDRFTREQLAGDLLPDANQETRVGSAFNRLLLTTEEGGAQAKDYEARYLTDRVRAVGTTWLGLTTGCANCHDHKFDPITQRDFFRLGAYFADIEEGIIGAREPGMPVLSPAQAAELDAAEKRVTALRQEISQKNTSSAAERTLWEQQQRAELPEESNWQRLAPVRAVADAGRTLTIEADATVFVTGPKDSIVTYTVDTAPTGAVSAVRLEALADARLPANGPGRAGNGNFVLTELVVSVVEPGQPDRLLTLRNAVASVEQREFAVGNPYGYWAAQAAIDGDTRGATWGWAILPQAGRNHYLVAQLTEPITLKPGQLLRFALRQHHDNLDHSLGKFRLSVTNDTAALERLAPTWRMLLPTGATAQSGATLTVRPDHSILARGVNPDKDTYTIDLSAEGTVGALRLEALSDVSLPERGPGRANNGNFVVSEVIAEAIRTGGQPRRLKLRSAQATFEQVVVAEGNPYQRWGAASVIDDDVKGAQWGWAILPATGQDHALTLTLAEPWTVQPGESLRVTVRQNLGGNHTLGCFRLAAAATPADRPSTRVEPPTEVSVILGVEPTLRTAEQQRTINNYFELINPALAVVRQELITLQERRRALEESAPKCLVSVKNSTPRTVRILPRGNFLDESGEVVTAALPGFLASPPQPSSPGRSSLTGKGGSQRGDSPFPSDAGAKGGRLELANWLLAKENPLTARAVMNRVWKQFFGNGLSKVLDDLGAQGEPPTNPALLDWLACEFRDSGWDTKHMVRLLVNSNTYKQVSTASKALQTRDPYNREYARQSRFRLDAELVRDNALAISGLLVPKIGGPSVKPYQPERYWENLNFPVRDYVADKGESQWRRGLYTWWQRSFLHPSLLAFDAPSREECTADRTRSNIPQQALVLLNDPTYVETARAFGARILEQPADQRLTWACQQALQRSPSPRERTVLQGVFDQQLAAYRTDPAAAEAFLKTGFAPVPATLDKAELAAWTHVARVLLNLHETITRS